MSVEPVLTVGVDTSRLKVRRERKARGFEKIALKLLPLSPPAVTRRLRGHWSRRERAGGAIAAAAAGRETAADAVPHHNRSTSSLT